MDSVFVREELPKSGRLSGFVSAGFADTGPLTYEKGDRLDMDKDSRTQVESAQADASASLASDLETSARLIEEARREWHAVAASLDDLKKSLAPDDFASAMEQMKIPGLEAMIDDWRKAHADYRETLTSATAVGEGDTRPGRVARRRKRPARSRPAKRRAPPPPSRSERDSSARKTPEDTADTTTDIRSQLAELTSLLRQHVEFTMDQGSGPRLELPRQLTLSIAREVAGRVKDSVLETLRERGAGENGRDSGPSGERRSEKEPKKVPLDDIAAMIDQLTKL